MGQRRYPSCVPTLAAIVRAARGSKSQIAFERDTGISIKVLRNFEKGRKVEPESVDKVKAAFPDLATAIDEAIAQAERSSRPVVYRHTDERGAVRSEAQARSVDQQPASRGEEQVWHSDPHWAALAGIWASLSVEVHHDLVTRASRAAARLAATKAQTAPKAVGRAAGPRK